MSRSKGKSNWAVGTIPDGSIRVHGVIESLDRTLIGFTCPVRCSGQTILKCYELARNLRDLGVSVAGRFVTPMELEMLDFLVRGDAPVVVVRDVGFKLRQLSPNWRKLLDGGRIVILQPGRTSGDTSEDLLLLFADALVFGHSSPESECPELWERSLRKQVGYSLENRPGAPHLKSTRMADLRKFVGGLGARKPEASPRDAQNSQRLNLAQR